MSELASAWFPLPISTDAAAPPVLDLAAIKSKLCPGDPEGADELVYLDCGAWSGDGKSAAAQRSFGVVCGRTAVLCEFSGTRPVELLQGGPPDEIEPINKLLLTLAGPMQLDVTVRSSLRSLAEVPLPTASGGRTAYLLLPDLRLPLVARLPDVDPDLVPDPNMATCSCHGPVVTRMLYGTKEAPSRYRVVGAPLSRNPNDWFYWMAESYKEVAADMIKLLDRLSKHPPGAPAYLVQLGRLCEVWTGYQCVLSTMGRAAFVRPTQLHDDGPEALFSAWSDKVLPSKNHDAVMRLIGFSQKRRSLLDDHQNQGFEAPGVLLAERLPETEQSGDEPPTAFLALREQKAQFRPWRIAAPPGFRVPILVHILRRLESRPFPIYAAAGTQKPCLIRIRYPRRLPESQARYVAVA
jgi:hypothetical protein